MTSKNAENNLATDTPSATSSRSVPPVANQPSSMTYYFKTLLNNMRDGVILVDRNGQIKAWSQAVEIMTGISSSSVAGSLFKPSLLTLSNDTLSVIADHDCPLQSCLKSGIKTTSNFMIVGRSGRETKVELTFSPVIGNDRQTIGGLILVHDASVHLDLKRQLKDLHAISTMDPLTQIANRAELERVLGEFVRACQTSDFQCSIIICDIDFFKSINDNYNHHIGDLALVAFAGMLKKFVRNQDIVARFGGEEFVILCADCNSKSAVQRAEEIRVTLARTPQPMLDGKSLTASFGVAQLKKEESATDFFVRADTALLLAKEEGRNRVLAADELDLDDQLPPEIEATETTSTGLQWNKLTEEPLISEEFATPTPAGVLIEKLRGFIIDNDSEVHQVKPNFTTLKVRLEDPQDHSRKGDFFADIEFQEITKAAAHQTLNSGSAATFVRLTIREGKRGWLSSLTSNAVELAPTLFTDLRRYLMLNEKSAKLTVTPAATESGR